MDEGSGAGDGDGYGGGINHYASGKWWVGENFVALCPVCQGSGKHGGTP